MKHYAQVLAQVDPELCEVIEGNEVPHTFYAMRWFMLLMCQDFGMCETLRLWDSLLSAVGPKTDQNTNEVQNPRFEFINYVAVALV